MTTRTRALVTISAAVALASATSALGATTVAVVGDPGTASAGAAQVAAMVTGWAPDDVVLLGDNYYASAGGTGTDRLDRSVGRFYCGFMAGAAPGPWCAGGTSPTNHLWPAVGNHEYSDLGIANHLAYFSLPSNERYFDVRLGPVHLFVLDSDESLRTPGEMVAERGWLQAALTASTAPFQVVAMHHPPYTSSTRGPYPAMRWPFAEWGADLVLSGHDHVYERLTSGGIPYIVNGLGGQAPTGAPAAFVPESVAHYTGANGAMRLVATDDELTGTFQSADGIVRDTFRLAHQSDVPPADPPTATVPATPTATVRVVWTQVIRSAAWARVRVRVALAGTAPSGATVRVASVVSVAGRVVGRGATTVRVGTGGVRPASRTIVVPLARSAVAFLQRVAMASVVSRITVVPHGGTPVVRRATARVPVRVVRATTHVR
ncbi:MAG: hypothetical protein EXQ74_02040 [Thermoleophilia bacterium]|nr:hypothetical protein [Thermoleophilia bacterium]